MKTITAFFQHITDPKRFMQELREILRTVDPDFPEEDHTFLAACEKLQKELGSGISPSVNDFLASMETGFAAEAIYIGWQGLRLNMDIFSNPANALLLDGDYEDLHRERELGKVPAVRKANETINAFYKNMRSHNKDMTELTDDIIDYYSYLKTVGYKIMHYYGFRFADHFLPYVIPGYTVNCANTKRYSVRLWEDLKINTDVLE